MIRVPTLDKKLKHAKNSNFYEKKIYRKYRNISHAFYLFQTIPSPCPQISAIPPIQYISVSYSSTSSENSSIFDALGNEMSVVFTFRRKYRIMMTIELYYMEIFYMPNIGHAHYLRLPIN